ncbi:MAG: DNA polymerase III subunit gamma/tau [Pseudohongiellaceae bacterium]
MTYQVLARKWRPGTFKEMVGQGHVLKTLANALDSERLHHAYLFTGTRGVGKTTVARILAKCLNCEQGVSASPCGKCSACVEISEGRFMDLIEVDAASRTKVEDTRELLENVQYAPSRGRFKIYLIDEVHMLSTHSFNALLKTLEEPPPHVKFLLATTDPQKLPVTVLSRCLQFNLKNLSPQHIAGYLRQVLQAESIAFEEDAIWQISIAAAGSMRDALTLLDQAISYCESNVTTSSVITMLGTPGQKLVHDLLEGLRNRDATQLLSACATVAEHNPDYGLLVDGLMSTLHRMAIEKALPGTSDNSYGDLESLQRNAEMFSAEDIQLYYQMCLRGRSELAFASDQGAMFEMLMIRMLVFTPDGVPRIPDTKSDTGNIKKKPEPVVANSSTRTAETAGNTTEAQIDHIKSIDVGEVRISLASLDERSWMELFAKLQMTGITGNILANCVCHGLNDGILKFTLQGEQSAIYSEEHRLRIRDTLSRYFGCKLDVSIEIGNSNTESPAARDLRVKRERQDQLVSDFEQDAMVKQIKDRFSATVLTDTITPIKN